MKSKWLDSLISYDGSQLRSLFGYLQFGVQGDSIIGWQGPCDIPLVHMVDGEDKLAGAEICGASMVHFIVERFGANLETMVVWQRLLASIVRDEIWKSGKLALPDTTESLAQLRREGDDLFLCDKKLSISIATVSPVSGLLHFAVNVVNEGTPVPTLSLSDLAMDPKTFGENVMAAFVAEVIDVKSATCKVHWVK